MRRLKPKAVGGCAENRERSGSNFRADAVTGENKEVHG